MATKTTTKSKDGEYSPAAVASLSMLALLIAAGAVTYAVVALQYSPYKLRPYTHDDFYRTTSTQRQQLLSCWLNVAHDRSTRVDFESTPRLYVRDTVTGDAAKQLTFETRRSHGPMGAKPESYRPMTQAITPMGKLGTNGQLWMCEMRASYDVYLYGLWCCLGTVVFVLLAAHGYEFFERSCADERVEKLKKELETPRQKQSLPSQA